MDAARSSTQIPLATHVDLYWAHRERNLGDALGPYLLNGLTGLPVRWSCGAASPTLAACGSILHRLKPGCLVWGSGCISTDRPVPCGLEILAVRGPRTRQQLESAGYTVPPVYGDPGLLTPLLKPPPSSTTSPCFDWGIIPHYVDRYRTAWQREWFATQINRVLGRAAKRRVLFIDPTAPVDRYLADLQRCRAIISSSLHGLVLGEAYGKPTVWIECGDRIIGGRLKFHDFFGGIGKLRATPITVGRRLDWRQVERAAAGWRPMSWDPLPLMEAFPFPTDRWLAYRSAAQTYFGTFARR